MNSQTSTQSLYGRIPDMLRNSTDKQCVGLFSKMNFGDRTMKYCAIGTIYHQLGFSTLKMYFSEKPVNEFMKLTNVTDPRKKMLCPDCGKKKNFTSLLAHLNDIHKYSFAQVADKLEVAKPLQ